MRQLSASESQQTSGGILWTTPVLVALADSGCVGPLGAAFGLGYGIGTYIYQTWLSD